MRGEVAGGAQQALWHACRASSTRPRTRPATPATCATATRTTSAPAPPSPRSSPGSAAAAPPRRRAAAAPRGGLAGRNAAGEWRGGTGGGAAGGGGGAGGAGGVAVGGVPQGTPQPRAQCNWRREHANASSRAQPPARHRYSASLAAQRAHLQWRRRGGGDRLAP